MTDLVEQEPTTDPTGPPPTTSPTADDGDQLRLVQWHLDRYDRLRASTASRASVVLSAGAVLSAGNALVLAQVLGGGFDTFNRWVVVAFTLVALVNAATVVLCLVRAGDVLVTRRDSRAMFGDGLPVALVFNGTDTVEQLATFEDFRGALSAQAVPDALAAAQAELWIGIQQHRHRYRQLRGAVRLLRIAAGTFLLLLVFGVAVNIAGRF
ncbi:hypothetical protein AB0K00_43295 [Dactylosporangium sp. NPDC049525]|uniref:hypothetical protein n=1 Tax=Dactylosporangium sp. NPDC049525 TaxID=3154730 RepID=UPI00342DC354